MCQEPTLVNTGLTQAARPDVSPPALLPRPGSGLSSAIPTARGSAAGSRTPMACSGETCQERPASAATPCAVRQKVEAAHRHDGDRSGPLHQQESRIPAHPVPLPLSFVWAGDWMPRSSRRRYMRSVISHHHRQLERSSGQRPHRRMGGHWCFPSGTAPHRRPHPNRATPWRDYYWEQSGTPGPY